MVGGGISTVNVVWVQDNTIPEFVFNMFTGV